MQKKFNCIILNLQICHIIQNILINFLQIQFLIVKSKMGNEVQKDSNVDIIIQLDKNFYYAGQQATGAIFINVKKHVRYDALYLRLQGHQFCQWSEGSSDDRTNYTGKKEIYKNEYFIKQYSNGLNVGNYKYTFSFPLNKELSGTFYYQGSQKCYIYYPLKTILLNYNDKKKYLEVSSNITIIQPMRYQESRFNNAITTQPICCCLEPGQSQLRVEYPTNHVKPGDQIKINIVANNRNCENDIESIQFGFYKNMYATQNKTFKSWKQKMVVKKSMGCAKHSQIKKELSLIIPNVPSNTAFGQITGNYYTLQTKSNIQGDCTCCCSYKNQPLVIDHFYIDGIPYYQPPVMKMNNNINYINQQNYKFTISQQFVFSQNNHLKFMNRPILMQNYLIEPQQQDPSYKFNDNQNNDQYNFPFQNPKILNSPSAINYNKYLADGSQSGQGVYPN